MKYGSNTDETGAEISANGKTPILVGQCVPGNTLEGLTLSEDNKKATLSFRQSNGATFTHTFWDSTEDWGIKQVNTEMLHICSKIVTQDEYYAIVNANGDGTFKSWINAISEHIVPKASGQTFSLKIVYKENKSNGRWFANFPKYPNFFAKDGEATGFTTNPKYDVYVMPTSSSLEAQLSDTTASADDFPF